MPTILIKGNTQTVSIAVGYIKEKLYAEQNHWDPPQ